MFTIGDRVMIKVTAKRYMGGLGTIVSAHANRGVYLVRREDVPPGRIKRELWMTAGEFEHSKQ